MYSGILKTRNRLLFKSLQTSMSHKRDLLDLGSAMIRSAKSTKSDAHKRWPNKEFEDL